jgi:hypothetical protein
MKNLKIGTRLGLEFASVMILMALISAIPAARYLLENYRARQVAYAVLRSY